MVSDVKNVKIKYSSPARPPVKIDIDKVYTVEYIQKNFNISDDLLRAMFSPIDTTWEKLDGKNKKIKLNKVEDITTEGE